MSNNVEPVFENDELVLVWNNDKDCAKLQYFGGYSKSETHRFICWCDGRTSSTTGGYIEHWKNCAKICQKCEKQVCECNTKPTFKDDELVLVWNEKKSTAELRYFRCILSNGISCWASGKTSFTANALFQVYDNCVKVCQECGKEECECK